MPRRIVSMAPSVTETIFAVGAGPRVVGVTSYCVFPPVVSRLPKIGGYLTPSFEAIARLRPDLAVLLPEQADVERAVRRLGIPVLALDHRSLRGILDSIAQIGERCGAAVEARTLSSDLDACLRRTRALARSAARPRALICFGRTDDVSRVYAGAPGTIHHDVLTHAGCHNVVPEGPVSYPTLSAESLLRLDPDTIVEFAPGRGTPARRVREWQALASLRAVKSARVHVFTDGFLSVPGPRLVRFTETLAAALHGTKGARQ